ncbi:MAG TPA: hypothetical protein VGT98_07060 [Candidatus Elarobacter sp.]|nr:hypothetical protein [Candidatus Elarobacter sp.]
MCPAFRAIRRSIRSVLAPSAALALAPALALAFTLAFTLTAWSAASAQRGRAGDEPRPTIYRSASTGWLVDLPPAMEDALDRYDRDFEAWTQRDYQRWADGYEFTPRQTPWAVIGDFNGDGRPDVAIAGRNDRDASVVFILSTGRTRYRVVEAEREPFDRDDPTSIRLPVLSYLYPGRYVVADPRLVYPRELIVDQPAVQIVGGRRQGAVLYVVERNALVPYYLSDRPAPPGAPRAPRPPRRPLRPDGAARTGDSVTPSR